MILKLREILKGDCDFVSRVEAERLLRKLETCGCEIEPGRRVSCGLPDLCSICARRDGYKFAKRASAALRVAVESRRLRLFAVTLTEVALDPAESADESKALGDHVRKFLRAVRVVLKRGSAAWSLDLVRERGAWCPHIHGVVAARDRSQVEAMVEEWLQADPSRLRRRQDVQELGRSGDALAEAERFLCYAGHGARDHHKQPLGAQARATLFCAMAGDRVRRRGTTGLLHGRSRMVRAYLERMALTQRQRKVV